MQQPQRPEQIKLIKPSLSINIQKQALSPTQSKELSSPTDLDSPTRRKKLQSLKKASDVEYARTQLNSYLDLLDNKVSKLVEKHEAQFLVAYRNHIKKVREEMEQIRNKALSNANSTVSQTEKIQALEKQLTIFREESLKLFEKVNQKQGIIYNLRTKINELQTQKSFLEKSLRDLTRRNKHLQGRNYQMQSRKSAAQSNINVNLLNDKQFFISRPPNQQHTFDFKNMYKLDLNKPGGSSQSKSRPYTTAINSKGMSIRSRNHSIQINQFIKGGEHAENACVEVIKEVQNVLQNRVSQQIIAKLKDKISKILTGVEIKKQANIAQQLGLTSVNRFPKPSENVKKTKSLFESKNHAKRSELQEYFYKSIEAVRKQITRRRGLKSMNFYSEYANLSLAEFKKVDFFRLLELLLSNDKIIEALHNAVFQEAQRYN